MWDAENVNKYSSKLTENFKGIVLKTPLILNVNCAKILAKKFNFIACVKSIKKSFRMMYSKLCLSFRQTVPLSSCRESKIAMSKLERTSWQKIDLFNRYHNRMEYTVEYKLKIYEFNKSSDLHVNNCTHFYMLVQNYI